MAQTARFIDWDALASPPAATPRISPVSEADYEWAESPARLLHQQLVASFGAPRPVRDDRLPLQLRLGLITLAVLLPWVAIGGALIVLL